MATDSNGREDGEVSFSGQHRGVGKAVGDHQFHAEYFRKIAEKCTSYTCLLPNLKDAHVAFEFMRSCFSYSRVARLMRESQPEAIEATAIEIDEVLRYTFNSLMCTIGNQEK